MDDWKEHVFLALWTGFDSKSGQTNDFEIGVHRFLLDALYQKGECGEQGGKFISAFGKGT